MAVLADGSVASNYAFVHFKGDLDVVAAPWARAEVRRRLEKLAFAFGQIRVRLEEAWEELSALRASLDPRFVNWRCNGCGYEKHFTKPTTAVACDHCPRCMGTEFSPSP